MALKYECARCGKLTNPSETFGDDVILYDGGLGSVFIYNTTNDVMIKAQFVDKERPEGARFGESHYCGECVLRMFAELVIRLAPDGLFTEVKLMGLPDSRRPMMDMMSPEPEDKDEGDYSD